MPIDKDPNISGGIWALAGIVLARVIPWIFKWNSSEASQIRKELRAEVLRLSVKIDSLQKDVDHWKSRYYELHAENMELRIKVKILTDQMNVMQRLGGQAPVSSEPVR